MHGFVHCIGVGSLRRFTPSMNHGMNVGGDRVMSESTYVIVTWGINFISRNTWTFVLQLEILLHCSSTRRRIPNYVVKLDAIRSCGWMTLGWLGEPSSCQPAVQKGWDPPQWYGVLEEEVATVCSARPMTKRMVGVWRSKNGQAAPASDRQ